MFNVAYAVDDRGDVHRRACDCFTTNLSRIVSCNPVDVGGVPVEPVEIV